ncbi:hypothetical protein BC943DRAFT_20848 [Umbelopsis sp. AD052]|nr:hypothetical protein BC943DRAFT_20848 [Umbelopsis sp. AD052]
MAPVLALLLEEWTEPFTRSSNRRLGQTILDHLPIGQVGGSKCNLEVTGHAEFIVPSRGFFHFENENKNILSIEMVRFCCECSLLTSLTSYILLTEKNKIDGFYFAVSLLSTVLRTLMSANRRWHVRHMGMKQSNDFTVQKKYTREVLCYERSKADTCGITRMLYIYKIASKK